MNHKNGVSTVCVPGFLGNESDFSWLKKEKFFVDIFESEKFLCPFELFSECLQKEASLQFPVNAVGYSLGGRLILNALIHAPLLFHRVVVISSHTGLETTQEKNIRCASDLEWVSKFKRNFSKAVCHWNDQPVFSGHRVAREDNKIQLRSVEYALTHWSLGAMPNLAAQLASINIPVLWLVGEKDLKYVDIAQKAAQLSPSISIIIKVLPGCGHRLMWEAPEQVAALVEEFLNH